MYIGGCTLQVNNNNKKKITIYADLIACSVTAWKKNFLCLATPS